MALDVQPSPTTGENSLARNQPTGAEALVRWLEARQVEVVFGCCGHGNIGFLDALIDSHIQYVSCPHEQIAVHAADAYFRLTHKLGVVTTTIGPGVGNILNGVMDASADCSSVLIIAGDTVRSYEGTDSFQEVVLWGEASQADIFRPVVKRALRVRQPHMLLESAARAVNYAVSDSPGPVLLSVAFDLFTYQGDFGAAERYDARWRTTGRTPASPLDVQKILELLEASERPVIYAGGGVLLSDATDELVRVAERFSVPVTTSMIGQSAFPNSHPLYAGNSGSVGTPAATWALNTADLLVALGTRFGEIDCNSWLPSHFIPTDCQVVQVDTNAAEVGKRFPVAVGVVADVKAVLMQLLEAEVAPSGNGARVTELRDKRQAWLAEFAGAARGTDVPLEVEVLLSDVQSVLPADAIVLAGSGIRHQVGQYYCFTRPRTHLVASGHATMGWVTAAAIGAKRAAPDRPVVGLVGDGDFRSLSESVGVAVEGALAPIWVVLNNASYNSIGVYQHRHYGRKLGTDFEQPDAAELYSPDYAQLAEAYGARGLKVDRREDLRPALEEALTSSRAVVIDVPMTRKPRYRASGYWDANKYLERGWNLKDERSDATQV